MAYEIQDGGQKDVKNRNSVLINNAHIHIHISGCRSAREMILFLFL